MRLHRHHRPKLYQLTKHIADTVLRNVFADVVDKAAWRFCKEVAMRGANLDDLAEILARVRSVTDIVRNP